MKRHAHGAAKVPKFERVKLRISRTKNYGYEREL
jgi:hypothetical protein